MSSQMQYRGAFCVRIERDDDPKAWNVVFFLDMRFYCHVTMGPGIPRDIERILDERDRTIARETERNDCMEVK